MKSKVYLTVILLILYFLSFSQKGEGKYQYMDLNLPDASKTYKAGSTICMIGFDLIYTVSTNMNDANYKPNAVRCGTNTLKSFINRDDNNVKDVVTLGMKLNSNYNLILSFCPYSSTSSTIGKYAEISVFYIEDGMIYNYPNKNSENSLSGKTIKYESYKDGTNNYLQKLSFGDGGYLIIKDSFDLYAIKLNEFDCEFKIKD